MDTTISRQIDSLISELNRSGHNLNDPVSKLMVATLSHQAQKLSDEISRIPDKVIDRICGYFIPREKIDAMPALCLVEPRIKRRKDLAVHTISSGLSFTYKLDAKRKLTYYPLFANNILAYSKQHLVAQTVIKSDGLVINKMPGKNGHVWIGLELDDDIESLQNVSFLIRGTGGLMPQNVYVNHGMTQLSFTSASQVDDIPMLEPFDAQQAMPSFISVMSHWRNIINGEGNERLIYITDSFRDRDAFKCKTYPKVFQHTLESNDLDKFADNTLWILFDFGADYVVPDSIEIIPNVMPVVNIDVNNVTLTHTSPIIKLTKDDGSYFLKVIETSSSAKRQGFDMVNDSVVIRDFDSSTFNSEILYRDVRNLYNRFIDDYYAFIGYHSIKDGELIKTLRETVNKIGKSVLTATAEPNKFDSGTYAMRNVNLPNATSSIKVSYLTTFGELGNTPTAGTFMENKKDAAIDKDVTVVISASGGCDKADTDHRYEMLRYYLMTSDRLYTRMDIDAFLRLQILKAFGKEEAKRINYSISIEGAGAEKRLTRGLYIDITFKDNKNYQHAVSIALDNRLKQLITEKSCLSMPVYIKLVNLE